MAEHRKEMPPILKDFLDFQKINLGHSQKTIDEYFLDMRTFFRFMKQERAVAPADAEFEEIDISDITLDFVKGITKEDINHYINYLGSDRVKIEGKDRYGKVKTSNGLAASSTNRKIACLKSFYSYLCEHTGKVDFDPTRGVATPKKERRLPEYLTEDESYRLLNSVEGINAERDFCIILLFLVCGLRVSEIVKIDIPDVRFSKDDYFLSVKGKGNKERQVFLSESCVEAINDYLAIRDRYSPAEDEQALFLSRKHGRISVDAVQELVKKTMKLAGLKPYSPHKLRHTAATLMLQNGVDVRTLQELLGHESLSTTQLYTHVNESALRDATNANPIAGLCKPEIPHKENK